MVTEATWQNRGPGVGLLAGVHSRQAWRPPALRGVESVLSGIASRNEPLDRHRARLTAWYEQFARRSQPFVGWQSLTTGEFGVDDTHPSFGSVQSGDRTVRRESQMISKDPPQDASVVKPVAQDQPPATHSHRVPAEPQMPQKPLVLRRSISGSIHTTARSLPSREPRRVSDLSGKPEGPMEAAQPVAPPGREVTSRDPVVTSPSAASGRLAAEDWRRVISAAAPPEPRGEQSLVRPAMRLAILRPINSATDAMRQSESGPISSGASRFSPFMSETKDSPSLEHLPIGEQLAFSSRLVSAVSSFPRHEVRGGFPVSRKTEIRRDGDIFSSDLFGASVRDTSVFGNYVSPETPSSAGARQGEAREPPAVIERLIERTVLPVALPGLQIRPVRPDASAPVTRRSTNDAPEGGRSAMGTPKGPAPAPAPPPLDINTVADKVYQTLQRRHQLERERRGLY